jgi:hypothetical protein
MPGWKILLCLGAFGFSACEQSKPPSDTKSLDVCADPKEVIDPDAFPTCEIGGRCVERSLVEALSPGSAERLPACAATANGVCVPEDAVRYGGSYRPETCSIGGDNGLEGRCLPEFVVPAEQKAALESLPNDPTCAGASPRCVPCFDPLTGAETGACSTTSCDQPLANQAGFASCVENRGKCIPEGIVSAQGQSTDNLAQRDCPDNNLCVPNRLAAQPPVYQTCTAALGGAGSCLDVTVLDVPLSGGFGQSTCPANERCVPCSTLGLPSGAPGCP